MSTTGSVVAELVCGTPASQHTRRRRRLVKGLVLARARRTCPRSTAVWRGERLSVVAALFTSAPACTSFLTISTLT